MSAAIFFGSLLLCFSLICHFARANGHEINSAVLGVGAMGAFLTSFCASLFYHSQAREKKTKDAELSKLCTKYGVEIGDLESPDFRSLAALLAERSTEARERERLISDFSDDVHFCLDAELRILSINPGVKRHWGYEPFSLLGKSIGIVLCEDDRANSIKEFEQSKQAKSQPANFECRIISLGEKIIDIRFEVEFSQTDQVLFCIARDISERKSAERMKQQLFAMLGHDLRLPLASVRLGLENLLATSTSPDGIRETVMRVDASISRVINLSSELLEWQQCEQGKISIKTQLVSLPELIDELLPEFLPAITNRGQSIINEVEPCVVQSDEDRVKQILANFISNASKYASPGATIRIKTNIAERVVDISVDDSGPGIPQSKMQLLFQPYARLHSDDKIEGTGLGLAISKYIAEALSGTVAVKKSDLGGASFRLQLPVSEDAGRHNF
jgi:PAS domain S-box-containing protein